MRLNHREPTTLWILAWRKRKLGQLEAAIASFTAYLEAAPNAENSAAVEAEIARLTNLFYSRTGRRE